MIFDDTNNGTFHGHVRDWSELTDKQRSTLLESGKVLNRKTRKMVDRVFYEEREWRYVPQGFSVLPENLDNPDILEKENKKMELKRKLIFKANDIKYIIVKKETEIPEFVDFIETDLNKLFNDSERKLLMSKLISVEQIRDDM